MPPAKLAGSRGVVFHSSLPSSVRYVALTSFQVLPPGNSSFKVKYSGMPCRSRLWLCRLAQRGQKEHAVFVFDRKKLFPETAPCYASCLQWALTGSLASADESVPGSSSAG